MPTATTSAHTLIRACPQLCPTSLPTAVAGKIDGGMGLASASSQQIESTNSGPVAAAMTISAWVNGTTFPGGFNSIAVKGGGGSYRYLLGIKSNGKINCGFTASGLVNYNGTGSTTLSTGTWYHVVITYDSTNGLKGYVNASVDNTVAANGAIATVGSDATGIGWDRVAAGSYWNGSLDEVRFASTARSADWITTEYNNQNAPGSFYSVGTEVTLTVSDFTKFFYFFPR